MHQKHKFTGMHSQYTHDTYLILRSLRQANIQANTFSAMLLNLLVKPDAHLHFFFFSCLALPPACSLCSMSLLFRLLRLPDGRLARGLCLITESRSNEALSYSECMHR